MYRDVCVSLIPLGSHHTASVRNCFFPPHVSGHSETSSAFRAAPLTKRTRPRSAATRFPDLVSLIDRP
jgi:hypothetical protein